MYVYIQSEPGLYTVGHYDPAGQWIAESDHDSIPAAAARVAELNGAGAAEPEAPGIPALRDYFAAHFLCGLAAGRGVTLPNSEGHEKGPERAAKLAYRFADAMLTARSAT